MQNSQVRYIKNTVDLLEIFIYVKKDKEWYLLTYVTGPFLI